MNSSTPCKDGENASGLMHCYDEVIIAHLSCGIGQSNQSCHNQYSLDAGARVQMTCAQEQFIELDSNEAREVNESESSPNARPKMSTEISVANRKKRRISQRTCIRMTLHSA